ncbi:MAG: hypothetical protein CFH41_02723 [Alphaproteobacteria bacterium MarineAlpha11_Bin1]|nr:MAG: hypothetical protein CFH41_02723 [Alphaproteobacteria bacterium MarineAlpha11_Bin1]
MNEFLNMGGYGAYVWPAWGIAVFFLGILIFTSVRKMWALERQLAELESASPRRRRSEEPSGDNT